MKGGASEAEHGDAASRIRAKLGGKPKLKAEEPGEADEPELPTGVWHVWDWFNQIIIGEVAGYGPATITWAGLKAWIELTGEIVEPWEARALVALGAVRASVLSEDLPSERQDKNRADRRLGERHG